MSIFYLERTIGCGFNLKSPRGDGCYNERSRPGLSWQSKSPLISCSKNIHLISIDLLSGRVTPAFSQAATGSAIQASIRVSLDHSGETIKINKNKQFKQLFLVSWHDTPLRRCIGRSRTLHDDTKNNCIFKKITELKVIFSLSNVWLLKHHT